MALLSISGAVLPFSGAKVIVQVAVLLAGCMPLTAEDFYMDSEWDSGMREQGNAA